jgi:hypothetical protein
MARLELAVVLGIVALVAACRIPTPTPAGGSSLEAGELRALSRELQALAGSADRGAIEHVARTAEGGLGSSLLGRATPRAEEIDFAFGRHCRPSSTPERSRTPEGYLRIVHRGVAHRSGAECTLVTDRGPGGKWRYVLRIRRGPATL